MRDVVNKNVTDAHIEESSTRVFSRGWHRLKLYFMIGLPTEEDSDVLGIVETGERMLRIGRSHVGRKAEVTVSTSSHVPKPHTPFQWAAQDSVDEIRRKQQLLRATVSERGLRLKYHDHGISFVEGVFSRGDRRLSSAIELAWQRGARFDGWDELFDLERWQQAFSDSQVEADQYLGTRPIHARLPWDHIDIGLEDGFLLSEYRKAVKNRLSPPCGKIAGELIHPTNLKQAQEEKRRLVCYDCGVACDLTKMREERQVFLRSLGAFEPPIPRAEPVKTIRMTKSRRPPDRGPTVVQFKYRLHYTKLGRAAFIGHLDTIRMLGRLFRRAGIKVAYSRGFHPKPVMDFSPALALGVQSLGELADISLEDRLPAGEVLARLQAVSPGGFHFSQCRELRKGEKSIAKTVRAYDLLIRPAEDGIRFDPTRLQRIIKRFLSEQKILIARKNKQIDVRAFVDTVELVQGEQLEILCDTLSWDAEGLLQVRVGVTPTGSVKPIEVAKALRVWGKDDPRAPHAQLARLGFPGTTHTETRLPLVSVA